MWCAAADPADPGVFRSKKYLHILDQEKHSRPKDSKLGGESTSSILDANAATDGGKALDKVTVGKDATSRDHITAIEETNASSKRSSCFLVACFPCAIFCNGCSSSEESSQQQMSEEGMFYCSLCEVEVSKSI